MKNSLTGLICTCLLLAGGTLPGRAQEKKPEPQPATQAGPADVQAPPAPSDDAQQQTPPQQTSPAQTPPAGQTPPPAAGDADQATQRAHIAQPPPPPPKVPDVRRPGETGYFVDLEAWFPKQKPTFDRGAGSTFTGVSKLTMQGTPRYGENIEVGLAVGPHNTLKATYTDVRASGTFTTPGEIVALAQVYTAGTLVSTNYHLQHIRLSFEYLTWPFPVGSRKFRLKTLWQMQYTQVNSSFDSPLAYYDSSGNLKLDPTTGQVVNLSANRAIHILSPMVGLGAAYYPSRHIRLEANGSGFGWPHHYDIWNADASLNIRVIGHLEFRVGGRALAFKTSTRGEYYLRGTFASAMVGLRWYSNSE